MSRKDKATVAYVGPFLLLLMLGMSLGMSLGLLQKWHEEERARLQVEEEVREARQQAAEIEEKYGRLRQWMEDLGLPIEVEAEDVEEEEIPAVEDERVPLAPEEVSPASDFSTAGLPYPSGYGPDTRDRWFPKGIMPDIDIYLGWRERYPEGYARLVAWGRGETSPLPLDPAMQEAARIAYNGLRWDSWIEHRLGGRAAQSPYYGRGLECAYCLWQRGRNIENALATLEAESTYGLGGSLYFGILYPGYTNTLEGYCDLLDTWSKSTDPWGQACFWNMPGYPRYQQGFTRIAEAAGEWRP
jgi:hypothetical protein